MPASRKPSIVRFISESATEELHLVLRGHLHLEAMLNEIIRKSFAYPPPVEKLGLGFFQKVKLLRAVERIDERLERLLLAINSLRNKIAHQIHFTVTFSDAFKLVRIAAAAGVDFSDDTIHLDKQRSKEWYGTIGILTEVVSNTFHELVWRNEAVFSQEEISDFLG